MGIFTPTSFEAVMLNGNLTFRHRFGLLLFDLVGTDMIKRRLHVHLSDLFMILHCISKE